jgi:hypothetical protein
LANDKKAVTFLSMQLKSEQELRYHRDLEKQSYVTHPQEGQQQVQQQVQQLSVGMEGVMLQIFLGLQGPRESAKRHTGFTRSNSVIINTARSGGNSLLQLIRIQTPLNTK